jgi:hypothetical protein
MLREPRDSVAVATAVDTDTDTDADSVSEAENELVEPTLQTWHNPRQAGRWNDIRVRAFPTARGEEASKVISLEQESSCPGCGGSCHQPLDPTLTDAPDLGARAVVLGSMAFFLGPILLAIAAAAIFDDNGAVQFAATTAALGIGMVAAWLAGRLFGFSHKESE